MLNFFDDEVTLPGESNLDGLAGRSCEIAIGSNPSTSNEDDGYYNVNFRMGISQQKTEFSSLHEIGISLSLEQAEVFCESLYNLAKQNAKTKERVEIAFSGDNEAKAIGAPRAYLKRAQVDRRLVPLVITVEPVNSTEGVAEVTLKMPAEERFFCSAILSAQKRVDLVPYDPSRLRRCFQRQDGLEDSRCPLEDRRNRLPSIRWRQSNRHG